MTHKHNCGNYGKTHKPDTDDFGIKITIVNQLINAVGSIKLSRADGFVNIVFILVEPGLSLSFTMLLAAAWQ